MVVEDGDFLHNGMNQCIPFRRTHNFPQCGQIFHRLDCDCGTGAELFQSAVYLCQHSWSFQNDGQFFYYQRFKVGSRNPRRGTDAEVALGILVADVVTVSPVAMFDGVAQGDRTAAMTAIYQSGKRLQLWTPPSGIVPQM